MTAAPLPPPGPSRRAVLVAGLALPLAACTGSSPGPAPSPAPVPVDPDVALRAAAVERERALLAAYDEVLAGASSPGLVALRAEHAEHLAALDPAAVLPEPVPGRGEPGARAVTRLRAAEREAAAAHAADALPASRGLAALLASLAAAEAAHGVVLA